MDQVTQQNAALVEQSAAAAESMKEQAQGLIGTVSVFKLAAAQQAAATPSPRPAAKAAPTHAEAEPAAKVRQKPVVPVLPQALAARVPAKVSAARAVNEG
jgi:hypothetical protein